MYLKYKNKHYSYDVKVKSIYALQGERFRTWRVVGIDNKNGQTRTFEIKEENFKHTWGWRFNPEAIKRGKCYIFRYLSIKFRNPTANEDSYLGENEFTFFLGYKDSKSEPFTIPQI
ncbi:hypothetical protein HF1_12760 [Mycoplasma haemofelis str. Langford 1]|uniref:Uncharacterized protein n=1 Tax=Mycoplasma haemofelis (strain Langford 1) TaxID=941640 RepID=E8ZJG3_MYCHL|nr:hypothetical protein [Mycoplasma haemofelis]CBY93284.1 hypothetical protein HF1_12760 [Mycoplasma haemofelis str. Langford 1]